AVIQGSPGRTAVKLAGQRNVILKDLVVRSRLERARQGILISIECYCYRLIRKACPGTVTPAKALTGFIPDTLIGIDAFLEQRDNSLKGLHAHRLRVIQLAHEPEVNALLAAQSLETNSGLLAVIRINGILADKNRGIKTLERYMPDASASRKMRGIGIKAH